MEFEEEIRWLNAYEAAEIIGFHHQTVREYCRIKKIKGSKVGKFWLIKAKDIYAYAEKRGIKVD